MENKLKSIFNIEFGSSKDQVHNVAKSKKGNLDNEHSTEEVSIFDGINYAGYDTDFISFQFVKDRLARTTVYLNTSGDIDNCLNYYEDLKNKLNTKYYKTDKVYEIYEEPYHKSDMNAVKEQGFETGLIEFSTYWMFGNDTICLKITKEIGLNINFENDDLISEKINQNFEDDLENM